MAKFSINSKGDLKKVEPINPDDLLLSRYWGKSILNLEKLVLNKEKLPDPI